MHPTLQSTSLRRRGPSLSDSAIRAAELESDKLERAARSGKLRDDTTAVTDNLCDYVNLAAEEGAKEAVPRYQRGSLSPAAVSSMTEIFSLI